ncbi:hypothetical protein B1J93_15810 [Leptospira kirschneri serovar Pomona]|uniref:Uncharacterized protein n=1 Tax=Leptospira kirschneri serovar Pomona TaxID=561005 RepID=A0A1T1DJ20_9LEPT|nr:hypothetical protein B1J93_15810 [Leptospira kirschneri serovar Pomona]
MISKNSFLREIFSYILLIFIKPSILNFIVKHCFGAKLLYGSNVFSRSLELFVIKKVLVPTIFRNQIRLLVSPRNF